MKDNKKDVVQQKALKAWIKQGKIGTCEIITGLGKTFIALHALYTMPKNNDLHLFLAETTDRKKDLWDDIQKYNKIFNRDVLSDYKLEFYCYQTTYKWIGKQVGLVIADEIHDAMSPAYSKFFVNNKYNAIIGLSATITKKTRYEIEGQTFTKGDLLNSIAPICFSYTIDDAQIEGTSRKLNVYIINNFLDTINKTVLAGNKKNRFYQTEYAAYDYWNKIHKRAWFISDDKSRQLKIRTSSNKRSNILYNLESKIKIVQKLLFNLKGKTIIFSNSLDSLNKVTPNVVSSKNSDEINFRIREDFDNDRIKTIGSFKKLKQGANLKDLDNCIIMSYYGTDKDLIQRIGRLRQNGKIGNVFIILTKDTQEEVWFSSMFSEVNNLNLIYCDSVEDCIKKLYGT